MFGLLLKKQLAEIFRSYFYNPKTGKRRSLCGIIGCFLFFFVLMAGVIGGSLAAAALPLCASLVPAGYGWLYSALFASLSLLLGVFGSVFSTYATLYLAKDNDLLLSMPISPKTLLSARLSGVYLLGFFYCAVVLLPAVIVRQILFPFDLPPLLGGILLLLVLSLAAFLFTCVLGCVVAKCSRKLKNKSFVTLLLSLVFFFGYYFVYYKAQVFIRELLAHIALYGEKIKETAGVLFVIGSVGEGDFLRGGILLAALIAAAFAVWLAMSRSFLRLAATSAEVVRRGGKVEKNIRRTPQRALLRKEFARFTSSAGYMLNSGLGLVLLIAAGVALLFFGRTVRDVLDTLTERAFGAVLLCGGICALLSTIDMTAPSVSLEGGQLWILQSMPVSKSLILTAKLKMQLWLTLPSALFCAVCALFVLQIPLFDSILFLATVAAAAVLFAETGLIFGLKLPVLHWTNELVPIKQGLGVLFALLFGFGYAVLYIGGGFLIGQTLGTVFYFALGLAVTVLLTFLCALWLKTRGAKLFAEL